MNKNRTIEVFTVYATYLLYVFAGNLLISIRAVYLLSKGITYFQLNSLDSFILICSFLLEIPTGVIGDRFGHKVSFQIAMLLKAVRFFFIPQVTSFYALTALASLAAIGDACWSGSFTAWYIGKLKVTDTSSEHIALFSNMNIISSIAGIAAGFCGGYISEWSIPFGYYTAATLILVCTIVLCFIRDEKRKKHNLKDASQEKSSTSNVTDIITASKNFFLYADSAVLSIVVAMFLGYIAISGIDNFWQPIILQKTENRLAVLGYAWVFIRIGTLLSALAVKRSIVRMNVYLFRYLAVAVSITALIITAVSQYWLIAAVAFALHATAWVFFSTLNDGVLYKHIPENAKVTVLSALSMLYSIAGVIGLTAFGIIADYHLRWTFIAAASVMTAVFFCILIKQHE
ncbi:MAG: MFS transporter [Treponema sp.]|uniref:MFS transporter n=1 Tax=Treponema sp. TaxID=166 RepID=UPI003FA3094A